MERALWLLLLAFGLMFTLSPKITALIALLLTWILVRPYLQARFYYNQGVRLSPASGFKFDFDYYLKHHPHASSYGDCWLTINGPIMMLEILSPELLGRYQKKEKDFERQTFYSETARCLLGDGILLANWKSWKPQRRAVNPQFNHVNTIAFIEIVEEACHQQLGKWRDQLSSHSNFSTIFDEETLTIGSDSLCTAFMGKDYKEPKVNGRSFLDWLQESKKMLTANVRNPFVLAAPTFMSEYGPFTSTKRFRIARKALHTIGRDLIKQKLEMMNGEDWQEDKPEDTLTSLISAFRDQKSSEIRLTPEAETIVLDNLMTFSVAGTDTTASLVALTFYCLEKNPEVMKKLKEEVDGTFGAGFEATKNKFMSFDQLKSLSYMDKVFREVLRMYPPTALIPVRQALRDVQLGDLKLKKGTIIQISPFMIHRNSRTWNQPNKFNPDRDEFHDQSGGGRKYIPFGFGSRNCVGQYIAQLGAKLIVSKILLEFDVKCHVDPKEQDPPLRQEIGLTFDRGLKATISKREEKKGSFTPEVPLT